MRTTMRAERTIPERRRRRPVPVGLRLAAEAARATTELGALVAALPSLRRAPRGDGHPVLVIPGLAAGDATTVVLRQFLRDRGYDARGWGLGVNLGPIASIRTDLRDTLEALADRHDRGVSLVGWSLGGVYALELGRRSPDIVRGIVTLGSPVRRISVGPAPTTSVWSRSDTVVHWRSSTLPSGPRRENVEVRGSHLGLGHNRAALMVIADRLAQPEGEWRPFDPAAYGSLFPTDAARPAGI